MSQSDKARAFAALHVPGDPVILYNAWDAGSAKAVAEAGARAIATGSASVAAAHGFSDAEALPLELALANAERIVAAVELPVTIDFEGGYAVDARGRRGQCREAGGDRRDRLQFRGSGGRRRGAAPDRVPGGADPRRARARPAPDFFINARTDIFLKASAESHDEAMVDAALERAPAYAEAGRERLLRAGARRSRAARAALRGLAAAGQFHGLSRRAVGRRGGGDRGSRGSATGRSRTSLAMKALKDAAAAIYAR